MSAVVPEEYYEETPEWRYNVALLDTILGPRDNFVKASVHSSRHGVEGYHAHFTYRYCWNRTVEKWREYGFRFHSLATDSYRDGADFRIQLVRERPLTMDDHADIDPEHYLMPE